MTIPLVDGYSVLELTETAAGAFCARLLADLGCDVVKIEPPEGDPARRRGAFPGDVPNDEASGAFLFLNENKCGITLDLTTATGAEIAVRLAARVDVLIEDLPPSLLAERGLGYDELSRSNSSLVMVSIAPFRRAGPHRDWKAQPLTTSHAGGQAAPSFAGRAPVVPGRLWGELQCGLTAALACLGALAGRETLGGQHVEVSKQDALASLARVGPGRPGEGVVGGMLPCRDGWIQCVVSEERHWSALLELLGHPAWESEPRLATQAERLARAGEVYELLAAETAKRTASELSALGQELGCPIGTPLLAPEMLASKQLAARGFFSEVVHPRAGALRYPSLPFAVSEETPRDDRPAPLLGEHNGRILEELGFDERATALLVATEVI